MPTIEDPRRRRPRRSGRVRPKPLRALALFAIFVATAAGLAALAAPTVPPSVEMPGTQPNEITIEFPSSDKCQACHANIAGQDDELSPYYGWQGGMMSHSARDPLFWAALAVAEQDWLPDADPGLRGGAGDFCLRCHVPNAFLNGRSTPTDGSTLDVGTADRDGVVCMHCHQLVNPDPPTNVPGTVELQTAPYLANDGTDPYVGAGMYVVNDTSLRLGPYDNLGFIPHDWAQSALHRQSELCGTCHDVSNPIVGDLAHNFGSQLPLDPGTFSGNPNSPVSQKAAFNNPPQEYGTVERTYSEWKGSAYSTLLVNDFNTLPAILKTTGGALERTYDAAYQPFTMTANYQDGTPRFFTCQSCHMRPATGQGCSVGSPPTRTDLPTHDQTGSGYWVPKLIQHMDNEGTLRFGGGLTQTVKDAMDDGVLRAEEMLSSAAVLDGTAQGDDLVVRVTNLTGHKLITGYPEGRRMWLNVQYYDVADQLVGESGAYGQIGRTVEDRDGTVWQVESIIDPANTVIYGAYPAMDPQWASQLIGLGLDPGMVLAYDRMTDLPTKTLGQLAADPPGTVAKTFHFVLNNRIAEDNRIPPYRMDHDAALTNNFLPVPPTQYGNPGPGGEFDYWSIENFPIPAQAVRAEVRLLFQQSSWEYVQFLWLNNDEQNTFLADEGIHLLDGWLNAVTVPPQMLGDPTRRQGWPFEMAMIDVDLTVAGTAPGEASPQGQPADLMTASWNDATGEVDVAFTPACDASDHTIVFGPLDQVASYGYDGAACHAGTGGTTSFDAGSNSVFFLVVGNTGLAEGSYGKASDTSERPEYVGTPGCDLVQDLSATCN